MFQRIKKSCSSIGGIGWFFGTLEVFAYLYFAWKGIFDNWNSGLVALAACFVALLPLPFNQNTIWKVLDWFFRLLDDGGRWLISCAPVNKTKWANGFKERRPLLKMAAYGVLLIVVIVFPTTPVSFFPWLSELIARIPKFERWEWAVFVWSATFLIFFTSGESFEYWEAAKSEAVTAGKVGIAGAATVVVLTCVLIALMLTPGLPAIVRLFAELGLCGLICIKGSIFARLYRKRSAERADLNLGRKAKNFVEALVLIDLPGFAAFGALVLYGLNHFPDSDLLPGNWQLFYDMVVHGWEGGDSHLESTAPHAFVSGAAALNLILINVSYISLSIWQVYEDASDQPKSLHIPDQRIAAEAKH
jgi:hypothetical protein